MLSLSMIIMSIMSFTGGISSNQLTGAILLIFATVELVLNAADDSRDYPERMVRLRELSRLASLYLRDKTSDLQVQFEEIQRDGRDDIGIAEFLSTSGDIDALKKKVYVGEIWKWVNPIIYFFGPMCLLFLYKKFGV